MCQVKPLMQELMVLLLKMGFINHHFFADVDPFLAKLRGDPRFAELMERAREKQREIEGEN